MSAVSTPTPPKAPRRRRFRDFWARVTEGLRLDQLPPRSVHGHAIERRIHRRQQPGNVIFAALLQHMQSPRAILAA